MSFQSIIPLATYVSDGVALSYPIPDKFYDAADIKVFVVSPAGVETQLVQGVGFSVSITLTDPTPPSRKLGNVLFVTNPGALYSIVVLIWPGSDQDQPFEGRPVSPRQNERVHDRHSMRDAAVRQFLQRGFRAPLNTAPGLRYIGVGLPGQTVVYDAAGNLIPSSISTFVNRGIWDPLYQYSVNDVVSYGGKLWAALAPVLGVAPVQGAAWTIFLEPIPVADGDKGDIVISSAGTVWSLDAVVSEAKVVATASDALRITIGTIAHPAKYGICVGDGITDCSAAINSMEDSRRFIELPEGDFVCDNPLVFNHDGRRLVGMGKEVTNLIARSSSNSLISVPGNLRNLTLENFSLKRQPTIIGIAATINVATPAVVTAVAHGLANGSRVKFSTAGALPTGLNTSAWYSVINVTANTFQLSFTAGGPAIATTGAGAGLHTFQAILAGADGIRNLGYSDLHQYDGLRFYNHYRGMNLRGTGYSLVSRTEVFECMENGILESNSVESGAIQWYMDQVLVQGCGGSAMLVSVANIGAYPSVVCGEMNAFRTYANSGWGRELLGLGAKPLIATRIYDSFIGADAKGGDLFDTYGGDHISSGCFYELGGAVETGPGYQKPAPLAGAIGVSMSGNNDSAFFKGDTFYGQWGIGAYVGLIAERARFDICEFIGNHTYGLFAEDGAKVSAIAPHWELNTTADYAFTTNATSFEQIAPYPRAKGSRLMSGLSMGAPTGAAPGAGVINVQTGVTQNGTPFTNP